MDKTELYARANELAGKCEDAYSFDRYANWSAVAVKLLRAGFNEKEAEAIMRSKWARWAADESSARYGNIPAQALLDFALKQDAGELRSLVIGTFGEE